jgi:hypothetical protein
MNVTMSKANVYYLPAIEPVDALEPLSRWATLRHHVLHGWGRVRLSLGDIHIGRRSGSQPDDYTALLRNIVEEGPAELIDRRRSKPSRPATILDFETARLRLRPAASS